jgi:large subunit ribosomal protein L18
MSRKTNSKVYYRRRRKEHIRKIVKGTKERPRLVVYKSLKHIYAQLVDDEFNRTILGVSDLSPEVRAKTEEKHNKTDKSTYVGEAIAQKALDNDIKKVVFDRSGFKYHGRVKALADAARKTGLEF